MVGVGSTRVLDIWMNGELVGVWYPTRHGSPVFQYDSAWLDSDRARPLSLSLPFLPGNQPHRGDYVAAWFDNLLPESRQIRERIAKRFRTHSLQAFDLLAAIGRDCVGAVQLMPGGADPGNIRQIRGRELDEHEVATLLRETTAPPLFGHDDAAELRISVAGAQEKTALLREGARWLLPEGATPTTHILKLPLGLIGPLRADLQDSVENEWLSIQLLRLLGLPTADVEIGRFRDERGEVKVLVVKRFDRALADSVGKSDENWIVRLPQEDFCQATGTPPERKYEGDGGPGIPTILPMLLGGDDPGQDALTFAKAQLAFWLLAAPDGHAKNFSIFLTRSGYKMTPLYDVLSAWPIIGNGPNEWTYQKITLAMAIRGSRPYRHLDQISVRHWQRLATATGETHAFEQMVGLVERTETALSELQSQLPPEFPERVWSRVSEGVSRHRAHFLDVLSRTANVSRT